MAEYTRRVHIAGKDFTGVFDKVSFGWVQIGGCDQATLGIASLSFDEDLGIEMEDDVQIGFNISDIWFRGIVVEISTSSTGGLTIKCVGSKVLLTEIIPRGRYGEEVETIAPTLTVLTEAAADSTAPGATVGDHIFVITALDAEGETWSGTATTGSGTSPTAGILFAKLTVSGANKKITVSWTASTFGATGYRVYMNDGEDGTVDADFTSAGGMVFFDVVGTSFVIDGSVAGEGKDFPFTAEAGRTSIQPTIAAFDITDAVGDLLDTWLPATMTKGTVSLPTFDAPLKFFDLNDSGGSFDKVLDSLVHIAGNAHWYVDGNNQVHFRELQTSLYGTFFLKGDGTDISNETDVMVNISRRKSRDGVTTVKIEGEPEFEAGKDNCTIENAGITWDDTTEGTSLDVNFVNKTKDPRVISSALPPAPTVTIPATADRAYVLTFTIQTWLDAFPNYRWLYIMATNGESDVKIKQILAAIRLRGYKTSFIESFGGRPRMVLLPLPGLKHIMDAGTAGYNWLLRRKVNPEVWSAQLDALTTLFIPGQGQLRVVTDKSVQYDLDIQSIAIEFGDTVSATAQLGDEEVSPPKKDKEQARESAVRASLRFAFSARWSSSL